MTDDRHPLVRAMYDEDGTRREPGDIDFMMLPLELRQLLGRASRLARLTEMNAPAAILEQERRLVAESTLTFNNYVSGRVLAPAAKSCNEQADERTRQQLQAHLVGRHGLAEVSDEATCNVLIELHNDLHDHPPHGAPDHEDYDYDYDEGR